MHRRDLFRILAAGAALPALTPNALAMLREVQSAPARDLKTLNPHQDATVSIMAERIIPETTTPGAKGAKVNEFIDVSSHRLGNSGRAQTIPRWCGRR